MAASQEHSTLQRKWLVWNNCPLKSKKRKKHCKLTFWDVPAGQLVHPPVLWSMFNAVLQISPKCGLSTLWGPPCPYGRAEYTADPSIRHCCAAGTRLPVLCEWSRWIFVRQKEYAFQDADNLWLFGMGGLGIPARCGKASLGQQCGNQFFFSQESKTHFNYLKVYSTTEMQF